MKTVYRCEKCGLTFEDYEKAEIHENKHFTVKTWYDDTDEKVVERDTEYVPELFAPSAVVIPMVRSFYEDGEWKKETAYVKYYYSGKKSAEQVFPIDESVIG